MKRPLLVWLCPDVLFLAASAAPAQESKGTKEEAVAMVQKAVAAIKADGKEKPSPPSTPPRGPTATATCTSWSTTSRANAWLMS